MFSVYEPKKEHIISFVAKERKVNLRVLYLLGMMLVDVMWGFDRLAGE